MTILAHSLSFAGLLNILGPIPDAELPFLGSAAPPLSSKPQFLLQRAQTAQQGAELPACFFFSP